MSDIALSDVDQSTSALLSIFQSQTSGPVKYFNITQQCNGDRIPQHLRRFPPYVLAELVNCSICVYCVARFYNIRDEALLMSNVLHATRMLIPQDICQDIYWSDPTISTSYTHVYNTILQNNSSVCPLCFDLSRQTQGLVDNIVQSIDYFDYEFRRMAVTKTVPSGIHFLQCGMWLHLRHLFSSIVSIFKDSITHEGNIVEIKELLKMHNNPVVSAINTMRSNRVDALSNGTLTIPSSPCTMITHKYSINKEPVVFDMNSPFKLFMVYYTQTPNFASPLSRLLYRRDLEGELSASFHTFKSISMLPPNLLESWNLSPPRSLDHTPAIDLSCNSNTSAVYSDSILKRYQSHQFPLPLPTLPLSLPRYPTTHETHYVTLMLNPWLCVQIGCHHDPIYFSGQYVKQSRLLSQTSWYRSLLQYQVAPGSAAATTTVPAIDNNTNDNKPLDNSVDSPSQQQQQSQQQQKKKRPKFEQDDDGHDDDIVSLTDLPLQFTGDDIDTSSLLSSHDTSNTPQYDASALPYAESSVETEIIHRLLPYYHPVSKFDANTYSIFPNNSYDYNIDDVIAIHPYKDHIQQLSSSSSQLSLPVVPPKSNHYPGLCAIHSTNPNGILCTSYHRASNHTGPNVISCLNPYRLLFHSGYSYKFHSSGREDLNVRMLGHGRPYCIELCNPHRLPACTPELLESLKYEINMHSTCCQVTSLNYADSYVMQAMMNAIGEKRKKYRCVVTSSRSLTRDDLSILNNINELIIVQNTPTRVLLRRSALPRERNITNIRATYVNPHFFYLDIETQAGTYVKEFVHSDKGRTHPSISSLLDTQCDILQLDVTDLIL